MHLTQGLAATLTPGPSPARGEGSSSKPTDFFAPWRLLSEDLCQVHNRVHYSFIFIIHHSYFSPAAAPYSAFKSRNRWRASAGKGNFSVSVKTASALARSPLRK